MKWNWKWLLQYEKLKFFETEWYFSNSKITLLHFKNYVSWIISELFFSNSRLYFSNSRIIPLQFRNNISPIPELYFPNSRCDFSNYRIICFQFRNYISPIPELYFSNSRAKSFQLKTGLAVIGQSFSANFEHFNGIQMS